MTPAPGRTAGLPTRGTGLLARATRLLARGSSALLFAAALGQLAVLAYIVASRLTYQADIEWMEGGMLGHALRLMAGQQLYAPPSVDFIPYLYTPLYPALLAALGKLFGLSYALGRGLSIVALVAALYLMARTVRREGWQETQAQGPGEVGRASAPPPLGLALPLAACGLVAAGFPFTSAWFDLCRNDSLTLALVAGGVVLLWEAPHSQAGVAAAALLLAAAFLCKQTAALFCAAALLALLFLNWRLLWLYVVVLGGTVAAFVLLLQRFSDGWFVTYAFKLHQGHDFYWPRIYKEAPLKLLAALPIFGVALVLGLVLLVVGSRRRAAPLTPPSPTAPSSTARSTGSRPLAPHSTRGAVLYFGLFALVGLLASALGFATQWAEYNAFIPGVFFFALQGGVVFVRLAAKPRSQIGRAIFGCLLALLCSWQLWHAAYRPAPYIPSPATRRAAADLAATLARLPGDLLVPYHPYYPVQSGRPLFFHQMGVNDVTRAGLPFPAGISEGLASGRFGAVLLDTPPFPRYAMVSWHYKLGQWLRTAPGTLTGFVVHPQYLFVRRLPEPPPPGEISLFDFESTTWSGFQVSGTAFGRGPAEGSVADQAPVGPFNGERLCNSFHGGDGGRGRLTSPAFVIGRPRLSFLIGGGRDTRTRAELLVDGRAVRTASGGDGDFLERRFWDVGELVGRRARLVLIDEATGPFGHLLFDDLRALP